jgi:hypothetical protein
MMCDTNWCTFCDNAISPYSDSLYCSEDCLRQDALMHHPMLGYDYAELQGFPHHYQQPTTNILPSLVRRKSSFPSLNNNDFVQSQKVPSLSPSLSSSISSYSSANHPYNSHETLTTTTATSSYFHPKPRRTSNSIPSFMDQLNQALIRS